MTLRENSDHATVYSRLRDAIIAGRFQPDERLKVSQLAKDLGTSTNPIREALQQLRGEGFVNMLPNRGARVRRMDETFVRDIYEIEVLLEPSMTAWFVGIAGPQDLTRLETIQAEIEALNFADPEEHARLDQMFHRTIYDRHYNRHAFDLWWRYREILSAVSRQYPMSLRRQKQILTEHRQIIDRIRDQDEAGAAEAMRHHIAGAGRHIVEQMTLSRDSTDDRTLEVGASKS
ncbi:GntR family transcriptional regulator [Roseivivax halodurans]|nr:GntR family transcriptional regulator [Roseivivax halodurans]